LNPCLMAENHVSWAWLDDGGVNYLNLFGIYSIEIYQNGVIISI